jgi:hypothetical protein
MAREKKRPRYRCYWDVEASDPDSPWDTATLIVSKREDGETMIFRGKGCMAAFATHIEKNPEIYFAHYGGGYDVPLLLNYWRPEKIILTGSTILCAEGRGGLSMRDTYPFWLASAGKIGEAIGVQKLDIDRSQIERLSQQELEDYCVRDVDVILNGMKICRSFLESYGVDPDKVSTAGTAATSLMQALEPLSKQLLADHKIKTQLIGEMLDSGANPGGMTACYALGRRTGVYSYDIKSSYPARYADRDVPIGLRRAESADLASLETFRGIALCSFHWPHRRRVPVAYDSQTGAGYGDVRSWLIDDEIQILLSLGIAVIASIGWCGLDYAPIGQDFARELFAAKERKDAAAFFPKVFVNSWHGKTGMNPVRDNYEARYPKKYWAPGGLPQLVPPENGWLWHFYTLGCDKDGFAPWHSQPMISAIILGRARAALWRMNDAFQRSGWDVYYNDTDSIMTNCPPDKSPVPLGKNLGQLAFEGGPYDGIFLGSKAYVLTDENGQVAKCALKGVPHRQYRDAVWDDAHIREARGPERLRGAGPFTRKGGGRDLRVSLFETALAGSAKAYKEGLATFKTGLSDLTWRRRSLTREIRPTINNLAFDSDGWRLLSADEIMPNRPDDDDDEQPPELTI